MAISIGVNAWIWTSPFTTDNEGLALIDKVKQMGFDSFEFGLEDPSHVDPAKLKERIGRNGLRLVICGAFGPDRDLTHDDSSVRENSLNYITQAIRLCQQSGCRTLAGAARLSTLASGQICCRCCKGRARFPPPTPGFARRPSRC